MDVSALRGFIFLQFSPADDHFQLCWVGQNLYKERANEYCVATGYQNDTQLNVVFWFFI